MKKFYELCIEFLCSKRMKSLYWRSSSMLFAGSLDLLMQSLTEWNANATITVMLGLIFGEITKKLNSN